MINNHRKGLLLIIILVIVKVLTYLAIKRELKIIFGKTTMVWNMELSKSRNYNY